MRLATWNVNSVKARLPRLLPWLEATGPDVLCLQETKCASAAFPAAEVERLGYRVAVHGEGRWNGVAVLSRAGLDDVALGLPGEPGYPGPGTREARAVAATCAGVRVWSVYVPNGRAPEDPHYAYKLAWLEALRLAVAVELEAQAPLAVCGDFNVAPTDADVWDPGAFAGSTHVTGPERTALAGLRALGLHDVVPAAQQGPRPYTYWDYRAGMFHRDLGMRIDLVYASRSLAERVGSAYVDRGARKGRGASDHAPVVVDVDVTGPPRRAATLEGGGAGHAPGRSPLPAGRVRRR